MATTRLPKILRLTAHGLLFLLALIIFYLGLGIGLAFNPLPGSLLWLISLVLAGFNVKWTVAAYAASEADPES